MIVILCGPRIAVLAAMTILVGAADRPSTRYRQDRFTKRLVDRG
ncbi:hypothetical protein ACFOKI_06395 [Sphingomonas qilianensis]|uniref:Uncharacterized protein n=1 Tax=Sphingomonas qilianensis TaxID=1736690 RepID=A0ABU9XR65_9SPHN